MLNQVDVTERNLWDWFSEQLITPALTCGLVYRGDQKTVGLANEAVKILEDAYIIRATVRCGDVCGMSKFIIA